MKAFEFYGTYDCGLGTQVNCKLVGTSALEGEELQNKLIMEMYYEAKEHFHSYSHYEIDELDERAAAGEVEDYADEEHEIIENAINYHAEPWVEDEHAPCCTYSDGMDIRDLGEV